VKLSDALPRTIASTHIARQLLRSGTAPAAHYAEARNSESPSDFIHKLRIASKELNETRIWLAIVTRSGLIAETKMESLSRECDELCRILNSSIQTVKSKIKT
jgi:four helix bundle protein